MKRSKSSVRSSAVRTPIGVMSVMGVVLRETKGGEVSCGGPRGERGGEGG